MIKSTYLNGYTGEPVIASESQIKDVYKGKLASSLISGINCKLFVAMYQKSNKNKILNALHE